LHDQEIAVIAHFVDHAQLIVNAWQDFQLLLGAFRRGVNLFKNLTTFSDG
jgi:hypothetical protein